MTSEPLSDRVSALEQRLVEVTARLNSAAARPGSAKPAVTDAFWVLEGLRERIDASSPGAVLYSGVVDLPTGEHYDWQYGTAVDELLDAEWTDWAGTLSALGHPTRLRLLQRVLAGTRTAADLATDEGLGTTGQLYHHLRQLVSTGWLRSSARGRYAVPGERVVPLLVILSGAKG